MGQLQARIDLKRGNESYLRGDFKIAIQHYDAALRHHPRHALANLHRAYSYLTLFRMTTDAEERRRTSNEAVRSFEQFLALRKSKSSYSERIEEHILTLYLDSDQPEKAVAFLEERLKKNPKDLPALQMLSNIKSDLGDVEGALQLFEKRIEIAPENPEAHHSLAVFAWSVSYNAREPDSLRAQAILDEGLKAAQEAMRLKPNYFEAITYANLLYREKAKHTDNSLLRREYESRADSLRNKAMKIHQTS